MAFVLIVGVADSVAIFAARRIVAEAFVPAVVADEVADSAPAGATASERRKADFPQDQV